MSNVNKKSAKQRITEKIKASHITNRLQDFALLEKPVDDEDEAAMKEYKRKEMSPAQVTAAFKLLAKVVPDLKQVEFDGKVEQSITRITREIVKP